MYSKYYNYKYKAVVTVLYVALLLAEGGEFFVAKNEPKQLKKETEVHTRLEIPDHIPETGEKYDLKVLIDKSKVLHTQSLEGHKIAKSGFSIYLD